jgi:hypothetical protein
VKSTLFDDLDPQSVISGLQDVADELREMASHNECVLDFLDNHRDELVGREYDVCVADAEATQHRARAAAEAVSKTILVLKLREGRCV